MMFFLKKLGLLDILMYLFSPFRIPSPSLGEGSQLPTHYSTVGASYLHHSKKQSHFGEPTNRPELLPHTTVEYAAGTPSPSSAEPSIPQSERCLRHGSRAECCSVLQCVAMCCSCSKGRDLQNLVTVGLQNLVGISDTSTMCNVKIGQHFRLVNHWHH